MWKSIVIIVHCERQKMPDYWKNGFITVFINNWWLLVAIDIGIQGVQN